MIIVHQRWPTLFGSLILNLVNFCGKNGLFQSIFKALKGIFNILSTKKIFACHIFGLGGPYVERGPDVAHAGLMYIVYGFRVGIFQINEKLFVSL